jgi:hypothetical protein
VSDSLVKPIHRRDEGGDIVLLKVSRTNLEDPSLRSLLEHMQIYGYLQCKDYVVFQTVPGNLKDLAWFIKQGVLGCAQVRILSSEGLVDIWTWSPGNIQLISRLHFDLGGRLEDDTVTYLNDVIYQRANDRGKD